MLFVLNHRFPFLFISLFRQRRAKDKGKINEQKKTGEKKRTNTENRKINRTLFSLSLALFLTHTCIYGERHNNE